MEGASVTSGSFITSGTIAGTGATSGSFLTSGIGFGGSGSLIGSVSSSSSSYMTPSSSLSSSSLLDFGAGATGSGTSSGALASCSKYSLSCFTNPLLGRTSFLISFNSPYASFRSVFSFFAMYAMQTVAFYINWIVLKLPELDFPVSLKRERDYQGIYQHTKTAPSRFPVSIKS